MVVAIATVVGIAPDQPIASHVRAWFKETTRDHNIDYADVWFAIKPDPTTPNLVALSNMTLFYTTRDGHGPLQLPNKPVTKSIVRAFAISCCMQWTIGPRSPLCRLMDAFWRHYVTDMIDVGPNNIIRWGVGSKLSHHHSIVLMASQPTASAPVQFHRHPDGHAGNLTIFITID